MKPEKFFDMIGNADDEMIEKALDAMENKTKNKKPAIGRVLCAAALFALAAGVVLVTYGRAKNDAPIHIDPTGAVTEEKEKGTEQGDDKQEYQTHAYYTNITELSAPKNEIYLNDSKGSTAPTMFLPADYLITERHFGKKYPEDVWNEIQADFCEFYGMGYDDFLALIPEKWTQTEFCTASVRVYNEDGSATDEYRFHEYGFNFTATGENGQKDIGIGMCREGTPIGQIITDDEDSYKYSVINGSKVMIIAFGQTQFYTASFTSGGINYYATMFGVDENDIEEFLSAIISPLRSDIKDASSDEGGYYAEAITADMLNDDTKDVFCGAYIDASGKYTVLLTDVSEETVQKVCQSLGINEKTTVFKEGKYTLSYLTELQDKISDGMVERKFPFVWGSGVYESLNRIVIQVEEGTPDELIEKVLALDVIGGAIMAEEMSGGFVTYEDIAAVTTYIE